MTAQLEIQAQDLRGCVIVRPVGEVDLSNASTLEARLCALIERGHMVVDLSQVTFLDSTGLSVMIVVHRRGRALGHTLRLSGAQDPVRRVFEITQLDTVLECHDDVGDAVEAALSEYHAAR
ncbi:MAG TPA: STAS domain-containing protein [Jiangellaceae bacterium]|nr:STAS domain-containing protein [Jiangellaceae bacterium]